MNIEGARPPSTRATTQLIIRHTSDVSFIGEQTASEKPLANEGLSNSRLFFLVCIGIMSLVLVLLTIAHLYISFKKKRKKKMRELIEIHVSGENPNEHAPLDPLYNNIAE